MRKSASISLAAVSAFFIWAGTTTAQNFVSSRAGFVNRIDGKVYVMRQDSEDGETKASAILGTQMEDGERLSTGAGSYAELLLNPGSYLRLNEKSELRAVSTDLTRVRFELISGSAIVETGEVDKKEPIEIITPNGSFFIRKTGLQRIDITDSMTSVAVRQGEIQLGTLEEVLDNKSRKIGHGKIAQLTGDAAPKLAKIDKNAVDEFDSWSFNRAEVLMAANQRALHSINKGTLAYGWLYDPFQSCYTFIPRGSYWSPYGFGFFNSFNACYDCYFPPVGYGYGYMGGGGSGRNTNGNIGHGFNGRPGPPPRVVCGIDHGPVRNLIQGLVSDNGMAAVRPSGVSGSPSPGSSPATSSPATSRTGYQHPGNGGSRNGGSHNGAHNGGGWHGGGGGASRSGGGGASHSSGGGGFHGGGGGGSSHSSGGGGGSHGGGRSN